MKIHAVETFIKGALAFLAFFNGLVVDFLQKLKRLLTFFALVLINWHRSITFQKLASIGLLVRHSIPISLSNEFLYVYYFRGIHPGF